MDNTIPVFGSGVQNLLSDEIIKNDAAQDELGWLTQDGRLKLMYGRINLGTEGTVGKITGLWKALTAQGVSVYYRRISTKVQYWTGSAWSDVITGLTADLDYCFQNYSSLAGAFVFISGPDGLWKINVANPASAISLYSAAINDTGFFIIDKGRMIMWNCTHASKTTLKLSHKDPQDSRVYTAVTGEATGSGGGTLAFKGGGATRNSFGVTITLTGTGEVYTDNGNGTLTGSLGGTGTIIYATGVYTLSNAGVGTAAYFWEDSNAAGITDFRYTVPVRLASEGAIVPQNEGGDAILSVKIGQDGNYYSLKSQSAYFLSIAADDTTIQNNVYRRDIGIPFFRAADSTSKGILFINTANPDKPEFTILQRNPLGDNIEPVNLFPAFKFANYSFSDACVFTTERYVLIACRQTGSLVNNRILMCDMAQGSVDVAPYNARMFLKDSGNLYAGSPISQSVYQLFNGFDDMGNPVENFWISKGDKYTGLKLRAAKWRFIGEALKKFRKLRFEGLISIGQTIEVYVSYDDAGFQLVGTILGTGTYVDYTNAQAIGTNMVGDVQVGGEDAAIAYPYMWEMKVKCPKFRKRTLKFTAIKIGYFDVQQTMDWDIMIFENRIPKRFRQKQVVSLAGVQDQPDFSN